MSPILVRNSSLVMMPSPFLSKNSEKILLNMAICSSVERMEMGETAKGHKPNNTHTI